MNKKQIYKIYGKDYKEMTKALLYVSHVGEEIPKDARIGIKPNLVSPTPAEYGATTHPELVAGIIEYLKEYGFQDIVIMEGSWIGDKTSEAYEYCGYRDLSERYRVPFIDTQKEEFHTVDCQGMNLKICKCVDEIDYMINVPVLKGHGQTKITCALKNMKGLIPNTEKRHFHPMGLHKPIAHLATQIHQDLIVVDHICGDLELEDGGNPIEKNCILLAKDPVLMDSYVCHLLGYTCRDVDYVWMSEELGVGSTDLRDCQITVFDKKERSGKENARGQIEPIATFDALEFDSFEEVRGESENLLDISYAIEDADSCSACYASLAPAILRLKEEKLYHKLLDKMEGRISIGQGFSGQKGKYGVGNCCRLFQHYVPGCPPEEEDVYQALLAWINQE